MNAKDNREAETKLTEQISAIQNRDPNCPSLEGLREKQKQFYEQKANGVKIRSRAKWEEEGEKPTRFFHSLE